MAIEISILTSSINNKSIDVVITGDIFESTDQFKITSTDSVTPIIIQTSDMIPVYNETYTVATLVFNSATLLKFGKDYILEYRKSNTILPTASATFSFVDVTSIEKATLVAHGTRFFTLTYDYPIQIPVGLNSPFYILPNALSIGTPNIEINDTNSFKWALTPDFKSINIESGENSLNVGSVSVFTNFPTAASTSGTTVNPVQVVKARDYSISNTGLATGKVIPTILSSGMIPPVPRTQTTVVSLTTLSATEILVEFSNAVQLLTQDDPDVGFTSSPILALSSVDRPEYNGPDKLIYTLDTALTPGIYDITINPIIDANGNMTNAYTTTIEIEDAKPEVVSANVVSGTTNQVRLVYSTTMNVSNPVATNSATNPINYTIQTTSLPVYLGLVESVAVDNTITDHTEVILTLSVPLLPGEYITTVYNVTNNYGTPLSKNSAIFVYTDTTATDVLDRIALVSDPTALTDPNTALAGIKFEDWNSKVVIRFNKQMVVGSTLLNSANNPANYLAKSPALTPYAFFNNTNVITNVSIPSVAQDVFRIPLSLSGTTPITDVNILDFNLSVGYSEYISGVNVTRFITSLSGTEVPVVPAGLPINKYAIPMNLCVDGSMHLISDHEIKYTYDLAANNNELLSLISDNLSFTLDTDTAHSIQASSYTIGKHDIDFIFAPGSINVNALTVTLSQSQIGSIIDLFGNNVLFETEPGLQCTFPLDRDLIPPVVKGASLISIDPIQGTTLSNIKVAIFFNKRMIFTEDDDFIVQDQNYDKLQVPLANILASSVVYPPNAVLAHPFIFSPVAPVGNLNVIQLSGAIDNVVNSNNAIFTVGSNLSDVQISTIDINHNKVTRFSNYPVTNFKTNNFIWNVIDNETNPLAVDSIFGLSFNRPLSASWFAALDFTSSAPETYDITLNVKAYDSEGNLIPNTVTTFEPNTLVRLDYEAVDSTDQTKKLGIITVGLYPNNSADLTIDRTPIQAISYFSADNKIFYVKAIGITTKSFISGKILATSYFVPEPYILVAEDGLSFVNTSYKAKNNSPVIKITR